MWGRRRRGARGGAGLVGAILAPRVQFGVSLTGTLKQEGFFLAGGERRFYCPSPKDGAVAQSLGDGHQGQAGAPARASRHPHVPGRLTCGRPPFQSFL